MRTYVPQYLRDAFFHVLYFTTKEAHASTGITYSLPFIISCTKSSEFLSEEINKLLLDSQYGESESNLLFIWICIHMQMYVIMSSQPISGCHILINQLKCPPYSLLKIIVVVFKTAESIATPCSVNVNGRCLRDSFLPVSKALNCILSPPLGG
jgi:hypothetical protein